MGTLSFLDNDFMVIQSSRAIFIVFLLCFRLIRNLLNRNIVYLIDRKLVDTLGVYLILQVALICC